MGFPHLAPMSIGVKAIITDHDLTFIGDVGSHSSYELQIVHLLLFAFLIPILIAHLSFLYGKEEPLQRQQRSYHVFADSLCLFFGLSSDLTVDVETCVPPAENLLHQGEPDELFTKQEGEDLMGEKIADGVIMEAGNLMKSALS